MTLLVKGGRVINPAMQQDEICDILIENGKIKEEVPFELGAKNGIAKNYDEKGNITQIVYKFGKIVK